MTETWTDRRPRWFALLAGATMGLDDIRAHNRENIRKTLADLATAADIVAPKGERLTNC